MAVWACLHPLAIWADDKGPGAGRNRHADSIMRNVMGVCLALLMDGVVG